MKSELRIDCPSCDNLSRSGRYDPVAYLNPDKGVYYCQRCHASGPIEEKDLDNLNVVSIKEYQPFDASAYEKLEPLNEACLAYLSKRFPGQDLNYKYGFSYHPKYHALAIPTFDEDYSNIKGIKYRLLAPTGDMRYLAEEGSVFGGYWLAGSTEKLLIVEGELDAITAQLAGFGGTVLALQTNRLSEESVKRVRAFKHVFLALDNDKGGEEGYETIKKLIYPTEAKRLALPEGVKDLNELYQIHSDECHRFLSLQTKTELERATVSLSGSVGPMVSFLSDRRNTRGDSTGWPSLDGLLGGGLRPNEMTVVNATAKAGKTSFILNLTHNLASLNKKIGMASFEMIPSTQMYPSLLSIAGQTNIRSLNERDVLQEAINMIRTDCPYLENVITLEKFGYTEWDEIEEWAKLVKRDYGIEYLVLDHSGFMTEDMTDAKDNQTLAKRIKKLSLDLGLHILTVVQAPKSKDGLSLQTAYGGMAWAQNADNFLILERDKSDETMLKVRLEAARYPGANPSFTPIHLFYDRETCTLSE